MNGHPKRGLAWAPSLQGSCRQLRRLEGGWIRVISGFCSEAQYKNDLPVFFITLF